MRIPIIPINNNPKELAIIELQGKIIVRTGDSITSQSFGPLTMDGDHAILIIGNHELRGKLQKLKHPLAVMEKGSADGISIIAVIRHKIVFSERPTIIFH